jgi:curved DNA-binding protein CbpA
VKRCPYAVLGVSPSSESFVIDAAYKAMLKRYHPDVNKSADAAVKTQELVEAYAIVGNPANRRAYDAARQKANSERQSGAKPKSDCSSNKPPPPGARAGSAATTTQTPVSTGPSGWKIWLGGTGIVVALFFILELTAPRTAAPLEYDNYDAAADNLEAMADALEQETANVAMEAPTSLANVPQTPLEFNTVERAARRFVSLLFSGGRVAARQYSEKCAAAAKIAANWNSVDECVAFDFAAAHIDEEVSRELKVANSSYFQFQSKNAEMQYVAAGAPSYSFSSRLQQVRTAAEGAAEEAMGAQIAKLKAAEATEAERNRASNSISPETEGTAVSAQPSETEAQSSD